MTFVKPYGERSYWEWDRDRMRLYNYDCGHYDIDENSDSWMLATVIEADSWHDLYVKTGYCPLYVNYTERDLWVSPDGICYYGEAHEVRAKDICEILWDNKNGNGDDLDRLGWIKLTTSGMLTYYIDYGMYDHITVAQKQIIRKWSKHWGVKEFDDEEWA